MLGAARCVFMAEQAQAGAVSLGTLAAFETSRVQVTALPGWPAGRTPKGVVAQGSYAHAFVRRSWKPTDNDGTWMDFQPGWQGSGGASDTIRVELDDASEIDLSYIVEDTIPTPQGTGVVRHLDATAAGGGDGSPGSPWNDWATAIAGLAADDVLVVSAKAGGETYHTSAATGGPSSGVDGCKIVADPDDIAAGRRPRVHVRGDLFAEFAGLSASSWDLDTDLGAHGSVYKSKTTFADPGTIIGGLYRNARGEWGRLYHYTDTEPGLALGRLRDDSYPRINKDPGATLYMGPGIYWNASDQKLYIRLAAISDTVGAKQVDPASGQPNPPWDWAAYAPASTDPDACVLLLSATETQPNHTRALDIDGTTGWEIKNIDFVGGGKQVSCEGGSVTVRGVRFLACMPAPNTYDDSWSADTTNEQGGSLNIKNGSAEVDRCEFWHAMGPWENQEELKIRWGAYGHHVRTDAIDCEAASFVARHCLFDGYPTGYRWVWDVQNLKHHHCAFRRWGRDGSIISTPPSGRLDYIRCLVWEGTLAGWSGGQPGSGERTQYVGYTIFMNARPLIHGSGWWDLNESQANQFVPAGQNVAHGPRPEPLNVFFYNCTNLGAHGHYDLFTPIGGRGAGAGVQPVNIGDQTAGSTKKSRNCIMAVYPSASQGTTVIGTSGDSHVGAFFHPNWASIDLDHDHDHLYRDPGIPNVGPNDGLATTVDSGGTERVRNALGDVTSDTGHEANGTVGDPQFVVTPDYSVDDPTLQDVGRYLLAAGSPCRTGGATALGSLGWKDIDVDGSEFTYAGHDWRGALEPDVPVLEQQIGPLGPMPSAKA